MSLHVAIEDETPEPDEPEGLFDCQRCGEPTWYALCNSCHDKDKAVGCCSHGSDWHTTNGCEARGCPCLHVAVAP